MVMAALYLIATDRDFLDTAGAVAGIAVAVLGVVAVIGGVVRWVTVHAIGDAVTDAVQPMATTVTELSTTTARLDARLTAHLDCTLHARIDEALARAVHPSSWGLMPDED